MYMKINKYIYMWGRGHEKPDWWSPLGASSSTRIASNILDTVGGLGMPAKDVAAVVHIVS